MRFVCPACKGELAEGADSYQCGPCSRTYPVICHIPDFRLAADPYIGIEADRKKGEMLHAAAQTRTFDELLRYYYAITPEDPPDLAKHWIAHALAEVDIANFNIGKYQLSGNHLLDVGCSTGAMLVAAAGHCQSLTGVDVAFRWLVVGAARLRECNISAQLVCAGAEHLPFPDSAFDLITATDVLEHVTEPQLAVAEARRVTRTGATSLFITNNRYAPLPDPQVRLWGVGLLPRRIQAHYVAFRRRDLHIYKVAMRSAREMDRLCRQAGYKMAVTAPAALYAPYLQGSGIQTLIAVFNRVRTWPLVKGLLRLVGPKLATRAER